MLPFTGSTTILMLEPDADDRFITTSVISELEYPLHIDFVSYDHELFRYLDQCHQKAGPSPALILLSLSANVTEGMEILKRIKANYRYNHIPVIVLTGIRHESVIKECYALGASSFIQKPDSATKTTAKIANFLRYWFETAELV